MSNYLDYNVNEHGMIIDAGRFEGEPTFVPYFWNIVMDGGADMEYIDSNDYTISVLNIENKDRCQFEGLADFDIIEVWTDDNGFAHHRLFANSQLHTIYILQTTDQNMRIRNPY